MGVASGVPEVHVSPMSPLVPMCPPGSHRNKRFHHIGEHVFPRGQGEQGGQGDSRGDRRGHLGHRVPAGKVKVFSLVQKTIKGRVIFAFKTVEIAWG